MHRSIDQATLQELADARVIREAVITRVRHPDGYKWAIQVKYGLNTPRLRSKRAHVRLFHSIDTAAKLLYACGLYQMTIDYS